MQNGGTRFLPNIMMNIMRSGSAQKDKELDDPVPFSIEDEKFDLIYPRQIRELSSTFWTPVAVAAEAAKHVGDGAEKRASWISDAGPASSVW